MHSRAWRMIPALALPAILFVGSFRALGDEAKPSAATRPSTSPTTTPTITPTTVPAAATKPATKPAEPPISPPPLAGRSAYAPLSDVPGSVNDLKALEARVAEITKKVLPAVVGVQAGGGQGSGVIVGTDGYVLTAGHVSGEPGRNVTLVLANGRRVRGKTLGVNEKIDSGLIKINEKADYPHVSIGKSANLKKGQWVLALGHPGGYRSDRPPVLRLGRVLAVNGSDNFVMTDCTLVGGDSGGPLFDLNGDVVGIHSRIGPSTLNNMHTPSDTYVETWERLARGEAWGESARFITARGPVLGIVVSDADDNQGALIGGIASGGPAEKAGMRKGDIIVGFDGKPVTSLESLGKIISQKKVGDEVAVQVLRDGKKVELRATLARRPRDE